MPGQTSLRTLQEKYGVDNAYKLAKDFQTNIQKISEASGTDEFFQFIIPKAKMQAENTITLEAEGDPSVFNMNLRVMRPADGVMMKLVKYGLSGEAEEITEGTTAELVHNHSLTPVTNAGG